MAISRIQQSQISGSLSYLDNLAMGSGLSNKTKLSDDLNALRSLIKDVKGSSAWYDAASQDLSEIYAAMHAQGSGAAFQGAIATVGSASIGAALNVTGAATLSSTLSAGASTLSSLVVSGNGTVGGTLGVQGITQLTATSNFANGLFVTGSNGLNVGNDLAEPQFQVEQDGSMTVKAAASIQSLSVTGSSGLAVVGASALAGGATAANLVVAGTGSFGGAVSMASTLGVSGNSQLASVDVGGGFGSSGVTISSAGNIQADGTLTVSGLATLDGGLVMDANKFTVANGTGNTVIGGTLSVEGASTLASVTVTSAASVGATLGVTGASTLGGSLSVAGASSLNSLSVTGSSGLAVVGASAFAGGATAANLAVAGTGSFGGAVSMASTLGVTGAATLSSTLSAGASTLSSLLVTGNAQVQGDLLVQGSFTYIETDNMKVKDAFIYLATGSNGSVDSGIVLSKGAGASYDLVVGQDGGAGEIIFAQVAHNSEGISPADLNGSSLVPAWLSNVKLGGVEGSLSGSLAASAAGVALTSPAGKGIAIAATSALSLASNGNAAINFADAEQAPSGFSATTIVGMLNELRAAASGGSLAKASYASSNFAGNVLTFSGQGTLAAAQHKFIDVYLNGVLMAPSRDLTALTTTAVTFDSSIVSALTADDVIVVITRG